jgi:hypothetical protein
LVLCRERGNGATIVGARTGADGPEAARPGHRLCQGARCVAGKATGRTIRNQRAGTCKLASRRPAAEVLRRSIDLRGRVPDINLCFRCALSTVPPVTSGARVDEGTGFVLRAKAGAAAIGPRGTCARTDQCAYASGQRNDNAAWGKRNGASAEVSCSRQWAASHQ